MDFHEQQLEIRDRELTKKGKKYFLPLHEIHKYIIKGKTKKAIKAIRNCDRKLLTKKYLKPKDSEYKTTLLHESCSKNNYEVTKELLKYNFKENEADYWFTSADIYANYIDRCYQSHTPLMCAIHEADIKLISLLLEHGVDINHRTPFGGTAIQIAVTDHEIYKLDFLIQNGADINEIDNDGETLLHYASYYNDPEIADFLIQKGLDRNQKNNKGQTCYDVAKKQVKDLFDYLDLTQATKDMVKRKIRRHRI